MTTYKMISSQRRALFKRIIYNASGELLRDRPEGQLMLGILEQAMMDVFNVKISKEERFLSKLRISNDDFIVYQLMGINCSYILNVLQKTQELSGVIENENADIQPHRIVSQGPNDRPLQSRGRHTSETQGSSRPAGGSSPLRQVRNRD